MAILQLTIIPIGVGVSVGSYVADISKRLEMENATFLTGDMGTVIEGDINDLLVLLAKIYETPFENGAVRVVTNITIDDRRDREVHIGDKTRSVIQGEYKG